MKKVNYYKELPEGYVAIKTIDAIGNKKFAVLMNIAAIIIAVAVGFITYFFRFGFQEISFGKLMQNFTTDFWGTELTLIGFCVSLILYIILHEIVHGIAYKILTKEKLTFGISLSCAYCGVPNIYVTKRAALISLLAPFTVFSLIFIGTVIFTKGLIALLAIIMFAIHFGGCAGDLYDTFLLVFRMKGDILMNDNGPKQVFYRKEN